MFQLTPITRSPAQGSTCKDLRRNGQSPAITPEATYTPIPKRAGSRSQKKSRFQTTSDLVPEESGEPL